MFGNQRIRLLRKKWPNAWMLSQELYAMFTDDSPVSSGPINISNSTTGPALTIKNNASIPGYQPTAAGDQPWMQFQSQPIPSFSIPPWYLNALPTSGIPDGVIPDYKLGGLPFNTLPDGTLPDGYKTGIPDAPAYKNFDVLPAPDGGMILQGPSLTYRTDPNDPAPVDLGAGGGGGGGGGGGASAWPGKIIAHDGGQFYTVQVYQDGLSLAPFVAHAKQLQIASDAVIPNGTWALVVKAGVDWCLQVPVWLDDLT